MRFQDWRGLGGVDEGCGEFAGVVHAEGGGEEVFLLLRERLSAAVWLWCNGLWRGRR